MYLIVVTNDSRDPQVFGTWETRKDAQEALDKRKAEMTKDDWNGIEDMVVVGAWKIN